MEPEIEKQVKNKKRGNPSWIKGTSANPNGRPKGQDELKALIKSRLKDKVTLKDGKQKTKLELIIDALITGAVTKPALMELLLAYLWGKPEQSIISKSEMDVTLKNANIEDLSTAELMQIAARYRDRRDIAPSVSPVSSN